MEFYRLFKARVLRCGSIGYRLLKGRRLPANPANGHPKPGIHILECELLEPSIVAMPVNGAAVAKGMEGFDGRPLSDFWRRVLEKHLPRRKSWPARVADRSSPLGYRRVLAARAP
jgi:hypothetical protein